ncbi:hypothetical protein Tco_0614571 [Tanacetum coccineum]
MDNTNPPSPPDSLTPLIVERVFKLNSLLESLNLVPSSSVLDIICKNENDSGVMLIKLIKKYDGSSEEKLRGIIMNHIIEILTYVLDFMIDEDISSAIDLIFSHVVLEKPFVELSTMAYYLSLGIVKFTSGADEIAYKMPRKIVQYDSLSDMEKEHT